VTPSASAGGYSGTPLAKKLQVRPGDVVALVGAPRGWTVPDLPAGARVRRSLGKGAEVVMAFVRRAAELEEVVDMVAAVLGSEDSLWIVWPRRAAGHDSDVTENLLREAVLPTGLVDVKVAAVGEDWSGLRFVWRREVRAGLGDRPRG
jgi:nucleoside-diphosphate-sugar epimerase